MMKTINAMVVYMLLLNRVAAFVLATEATVFAPKQGNKKKIFPGEGQWLKDKIISCAKNSI